MNILHTSDWHIGKRLMGRERLAEQEAVLDEIARICESEQVDLVLVAGDVFDTYLPSAEAEELFFRAVKKIAGERRAVAIVSGNHDDGVRLSAAAPFLGEAGVYLFCNTPKKIPLGGRGVCAVEAGDYYAVFANEAGEKVYVNALPYPNEARFREERTEESFPDKIERWIARGEEGFRGDMPYILLSHLFAAGGKSGESERGIELGGARAVPLECFRRGYTALGHLHRRQIFKNNVRYSGSILQYAFDEANTEKSVVLLRTRGTETEVLKEIPLTAGKRLVRLECNGAEQALRLLPQYPDCYIELTLHLSAPLASAETEALKGANEGLISLITQVTAETTAVPVGRSRMSEEELFGEYYRSLYGEPPAEELKTAFLMLLGEGA
ncbi:MAG: exonuclease subunit SbcD [Clostridia bacterium]|nr:exonuclease subunit SbcD [Clostridia bacterium]